MGSNTTCQIRDNMSDPFEETVIASDEVLPESREEGNLGVIFGDVGTAEFSVLLFEPLEKGEYLVADHETNGPVLCQIDTLDRKTNLSQDRAEQLSNGGVVQIKEKILANVRIIGYRDERGLLQIPRTPMKAGIFVRKSDDDFISKIVGLKGDVATGAYIGILRGHDVKVFLDINSLVQKHLSVLAKTGGGKSYITGVIIEELMKHDVTVIIMDPHGEYGSMRDEGTLDVESARFDTKPIGFADKILEFATDTKLNPQARPLKFTLGNLSARDLIGLTNIRNIRAYLPNLKSKIQYLQSIKPTYNLNDIIRALEADEDKAMGTLVSELEYL
ncbi:MAG TPA: DUF87 domain-containing protein, partial [Euryarchaeota archaeon]|nr:DUF87 domain-containing protein [Euryarchaeota archaeon]